MNNTEFRTTSSAASELNRLMREIENHRVLTSDFYEELRTHVEFLKASEGASDDIEAKKQRFKRIGVLIDELVENYWDLVDLLTELEGIEILENRLLTQGTELNHDLIQIIKELGPKIKNAHKSLRTNELGPVTEDLYSIISNEKFGELNTVLKRLSSEIDTSTLKDLRQKRIL